MGRNVLLLGSSSKGLEARTIMPKKIKSEGSAFDVELYLDHGVLQFSPCAGLGQPLLAAA